MRYRADLFSVVRDKFRILARSVAGFPTVENATGERDAAARPRALLVYLVDSFLLNESDRRFLQHQNLRQCRQIATALAGEGYCVDVVDVQDTKFRPTVPYDLVISHRVDLEDHAGNFAGALRVYLATGMNHAVHNQNMKARFDALSARRTCEMTFRDPHSESVPFVRSAHAIAGFGNSLTSGTWCTVADVPFFPFDNYGFASTRATTGMKNFESARRNFLFFASRGQVGKGLDLLLEVFSQHTDLHLHVCSAFRKEEEFTRCYKQELYQWPNIHPVGLVQVNSPRFDELTQRCACVILPSCSEGQPGSVVQCMHAGLVPIVTRECGLELGGLGLTLRDADPATIEESIVEVSSRPEEWHQEEAGRILDISRSRYSEDSFVRRWSEIARALARMAREKRNR